MSPLNRVAVLATGLLATSALSGVAQAQMSYSKAGTHYAPIAETAAEPVVNFTEDGITYQTQGQAPVQGGYTKGAAPVHYAPVEYVPEQPQVYEAAVVPVVEVEEVQPIPEIIMEEPGFVDAEIDSLIDELADEDLLYNDSLDAGVANFIRISGGYGFANVGTLNYGAASDATDPATQDEYVETTRLRGPSGSFRADVANFFIDGGFGQYAQKNQQVVATDLEDVDASTTAVLAGPSFTLVDGVQTSSMSNLVAVITSGTYGEDDVLNTTYDRTSSLTDFGGAAGYSFNFDGISFGIGVGGRRIQGAHKVSVSQQAVDSDGDDFTSGFLYAEEHDLDIAYTGTYVGPVFRVNFDQNLGGGLSAHMGGTAQALYGQRTLDAKQTLEDGTEYAMEQAKKTGFAFGGEIDAGLGFALSDNMSLSLGGFGSFLSAAPGFTAYDKELVEDGDGDFASMTDQSLVTYGVKGLISLRF